jgi:hypothetical protein
MDDQYDVQKLKLPLLFPYGSPQLPTLQSQSLLEKAMSNNAVAGARLTNQSGEIVEKMMR